MWPLSYATTVTQPSEVLCTAAPPERGHNCEKTPRVTSHPQDPPHLPPSQLRPVRQSSKVPTGSFVLSALVANTLWPEQSVNHRPKGGSIWKQSTWHSWALVGGGWAEGNWHAQRVRWGFYTTLNLSVNSGVAGYPRSPPGTLVQALCLFPGSTFILPSLWVLFHVLIDSLLLVYQKGMSWLFALSPHGDL